VIIAKIDSNATTLLFLRRNASAYGSPGKEERRIEHGQDKKSEVKIPHNWGLA